MVRHQHKAVQFDIEALQRLSQQGQEAFSIRVALKNLLPRVASTLLPRSKC